LIYDVVPIIDVYGPTGWDPNIQALVVSKETLSGAASSECMSTSSTTSRNSRFYPVASHRAENGLPGLRIFIIDVISSNSSSLENDDLEMLKQTKMSSTFIREWIVKNKSE
jgi:pantetheine-phosphate adenylyltransferase